MHLNDFGFAKSTDPKNKRSDSSKSGKGTISYMAPEILNVNESKPKPNISKQDVWAVGVIAY